MVKGAGLILLIAAGVLGLRVAASALPPGSQSPAHATQEGSASMSPKISKSGYNIQPLAPSKVEELAKGLKPEEAEVILAKGTERAFCGNLLDNHKEGTYVCRLCGLPLFASDSKFDSGTGWPSFFQPFDPAHVKQVADRSYGMVRTEILCARCDAHLGHVFEDGPKPTGLRFCLNSVSLRFVDKGQPLPDAFAAKDAPCTETAYFAGGCFWGVEDRFQQLDGVVDAVSGYMGGKTKNPSYRDVCGHGTGHAETVKVVFDPSRITYQQLLEQFFRFHDASQVDRQGPDVGDQYRSEIFAADDAQAQAARAEIERQKAGRYARKGVATRVETLADAGPFWPAEDYHQDYHMKHGGHCALPPE